MKGLVPLFLGIFGTFAFSWVGLVLVPNYQIGHLDPQTDEDGNDPYPAPKSGMVERGRQIYAANGCAYCHSQQMRGDYAASDLERTRDFFVDSTKKPKWGERRSAPRDYLFDRPVVLGKMRMGPDLANMGKAAPVEEETAPAAAPAASPATQASPAAKAAGTPAPTPAGTPAPAVSPTPAANANPNAVATEGAPPPYSAAWHHRHLYSPRSLVRDSNMPAYHFLYQKRRVSGEPATDALMFGDKKEVAGDWEIVPTYDAKCLVAYLMSLDQSHPLKEVKAEGSSAPAAPAAPKPTK